MKRVFNVGAVLVAGLLMAAAPASAQKIGFINSQKILAEAPGTSDVQKTLQGEMQKFQTELTKMESELDSLQTSFQQQQATLSAQAKQQRQEQLQQKFTAYQTRRTQLEETAQNRQEELVAPIMKRISEVIEQLRKDGSYAIIFDAGRSGIVTADPALDLTDQVLAKLKSSAPAAAKPSGK